MYILAVPHTTPTTIEPLTRAIFPMKVLANLPVLKLYDKERKIPEFFIHRALLSHLMGLPAKYIVRLLESIHDFTFGNVLEQIEK